MPWDPVAVLGGQEEKLVEWIHCIDQIMSELSAVAQCYQGSAGGNTSAVGVHRRDLQGYTSEMNPCWRPDTQAVGVLGGKGG
jgi:hypothetical protein